MISCSHWGMFPYRVDHSVFEPPARGYNFTRDEPQLSYDAKYLHEFKELGN